MIVNSYFEGACEQNSYDRSRHTALLSFRVLEGLILMKPFDLILFLLFDSAFTSRIEFMTAVNLLWTRLGSWLATVLLQV